MFVGVHLSVCNAVIAKACNSGSYFNALHGSFSHGSLLASLLTSAKEARDLLTVLNSGVSTRQARVNSIRVYLLSE